MVIFEFPYVKNIIFSIVQCSEWHVPQFIMVNGPGLGFIVFLHVTEDGNDFCMSMNFVDFISLVPCVKKGHNLSMSMHCLF